MDLMSLNYAFKNGYNGSLLHVFFHNKNINIIFLKKDTSILPFFNN